MHDLTPEQQARIDAALRRAEEIRNQIDSILASDLPTWERATRVLELDREMQGVVQHALDEMPNEGPISEIPPVDFDKAQAAIDYLREQHEPTEVELELIELTRRLLAKQGNILPDFEAFYRWRRDLERRISKSAPQE